MKTSTEIQSISQIIGEEKAIKYIAKAGFDAWDFSMFDMVKYDYTKKIFLESSHPLASNNAYEFAKNLRQIGEDYGIFCNQSHAPIPTSCKEIKDNLKKSIELTAIAGGKICVIHPGNNYSVNQNTEMYGELLPFAKQHNVKIATENMWNWDSVNNKACFASCCNEQSFKENIDALNDDFFVACVDIGHAEMQGLNTSSVKIIKLLKDKVQALHIHDTDCIHDNHEIPFSMKINYEPIMKALKDINYQGELTLEATLYFSNKKYDTSNIYDGIKKLAESAQKLKEMYLTL